MDRMLRMIMNMAVRRGLPAAIDFFANRKKKQAPEEEIENIEKTQKQNKKNAQRAAKTLRMAKRFTRF